jgi:GNAT superfamily N-acetyltransferase
MFASRADGPRARIAWRTGMSREPTLDIAIREARAADAAPVAEHAHGRGVGRVLVAHVEERARREGCVQLELSSSDRREDAHAFYRRLGFDDVSRRFVKELTPDEASDPSTPR